MRRAFIVSLILVVALVFTMGAAEAAEKSTGKTLTGILKGLFHWPAETVQNVVEATGKAAEGAASVVTDEVKTVGNVVTGEVKEFPDLITEPVKTTAETTVEAVKDTAVAPVDAAKEAWPGE